MKTAMKTHISGHAKSPKNGSKTTVLVLVSLTIIKPTTKTARRIRRFFLEQKLIVYKFRN